MGRIDAVIQFYGAVSFVYINTESETLYMYTWKNFFNTYLYPSYPAKGYSLDDGESAKNIPARSLIPKFRSELTKTGSKPCGYFTQNFYSGLIPSPPGRKKDLSVDVDTYTLKNTQVYLTGWENDLQVL